MHKKKLAVATLVDMGLQWEQMQPSKKQELVQILDGGSRQQRPSGQALCAAYNASATLQCSVVD